jgi:hypothetical protein
MKLVHFGIFMALIVSVFANPPAHAVAAPIAARNFGISPVRSELEIAPGSTYGGTLNLFNGAASPVTVAMSASVFDVTDQQYDYSFDPSGQAASWVHFSMDSLIIQAGQSRTVDYQIAVPTTQEPGGNYISLFATSAPTGANDVNSSERVGSLIYLTVSGTVTRVGHLLTFNSPVVIFGQSQWEASIQNSGTTHFRSIYSTTLRTVTGQQIATTSDSSLILPNTVRLVRQDMPTPSWIGIYRLDYVIGLGDSPAEHVSKFIVYAPPIQSIALGIIIGLIILGILRRRAFKKKHKNDRVN